MSCQITVLLALLAAFLFVGSSVHSFVPFPDGRAFCAGPSSSFLFVPNIPLKSNIPVILFSTFRIYRLEQKKPEFWVKSPQIDKVFTLRGAFADARTGHISGKIIVEDAVFLG